MNTIDKLAFVEANLTATIAEEEKLKSIREAHQTEMADLIRHLIKEEKLLGKCEWVLTVSHRGGFTLHSDVDDAGVKRLIEYIDRAQARGWYHFNFKLLEGDGSVLFNDSEVDMYFEDISSLSRICEEYGIKFDMKHIKDEIKEHTEKAVKYLDIKQRLEKYGI